MLTSRLNIYISYIFIVFFLSLKVVSLHVLTHDNSSIEHCEVCDLVTTTNFTPAIDIIAQNCITSNVELYTKKNVINRYNFIYSKNINRTKLLSRPPPFLV